MSDWDATSAYYDSPHWRALSRRVREKAGWTCADCGFRAKSDWQRRSMHAHHVVSRSHVAYATSLDVESNCKCLCEPCHELRHGRDRSAASRVNKPVRLSSSRSRRPPAPSGPRLFRSGKR